MSNKINRAILSLESTIIPTCNLSRKKISNIEILDVGSGDGTNSALVYENYGVNLSKYHCLDGDEKRLRYLKSKRPQINCQVSDFTKESIKSFKPAGYFDIALLCEVLEHIENRSTQYRLVKDITHLVKRRGGFCITFPHKAKLDTKPWGHRCERVDYEHICSILKRDFESVNSYFVGGEIRDYTDDSGVVMINNIDPLTQTVVIVCLGKL